MSSLRSIVLVASVWLISNILPAALHAHPDTLAREVLLHVGNFDGDCHLDSLFGRSEDREHYLPTRIVWGSDSTNPCAADSTSRRGGRKKVRTTRFQYPGWLGRTGTVSIQRINTGDSVDDLMFMIWGKIPGPERKDSLRSVVIFGGPALDSISTINFSTLKCAQLGPFAALDLCFGTNLIEPANREFNRRTSWILLPVDEPDEPGRKFEQPAAVAWNVKVFPNPVATSAQIEGHPVPPGDYQVEVIAVDGSAADRRRITVGESGSFYDILDLESLPSGFYVIRLYSMTAGPDGRRLVGSYPIVKTR